MGSHRDRLAVYDWAASSLEEHYDAQVLGLGYEQRARHLLEAHSPCARSSYALGFKDRQVLDHAQNRRFFADRGLDIRDLADENVMQFWRDVLARATRDAGEDGRNARVLVDISSLSRKRVAALIESAMRQTAGLSVDLVYSVAEYSPDDSERDLITSRGPVSPWFVGRVDSPRLPIHCVLGLGREHDSAIGILEHLEPHGIQVFAPMAPDECHYRRAIERVRRQLHGVVPEDSVTWYDVLQPWQAFVMLSSSMRAYALGGARRVVAVPFGPKLFSAITMLAAATCHPFVAVWRVSGGEYEKPVQRVPTGAVAGMRLVVKQAATVS